MPAHLFAKQGPFRGLILQFDEGEEWVIGRDPDEADFVLEDSVVSRKHTHLQKTPEGIVVKNLSRTNPTLVGGEPCDQETLLKEGDELQVGDTLFVYSEKDLPQRGIDSLFEEEDETSPLLKEKTEPSAYDTIFEDPGIEHDLSFHLVPDTPLLLKVIAGPNAGAEIGIETDRTYVLGKDAASCDIVFQDLSVSRNHAKLHIDPDGIVDIEDLGSKNGTLVNGQPILEKTILTPQDVIALGTTLFLFIDREAPQETIFSSAPSYFEPEPEEKMAIAREEEIEEAKEEAAIEWKTRKIPSKYLIAAGSLAMVFFIVFISFFSLFKANTLEIVQKEPVEEVQKALQPFPAVQFSFNPASGKLFLVGHVSTMVQFQEMNFRISQIPFITSVEDTVIIDESLSKMMNDLLNSYSQWRSVNISAPEPGQFIVSGYLQTAAEGQALHDYLMTNFPYIDKLTNQVTIEETLKLQIASLLTSHGFNTVAVQLTQGEVVLSGLYSEEKEKEYKTFLKQLNALQGVHAVKNFALPTSHLMARIDISDQYNISGYSMLDGKGYSVVINGKVFLREYLVDGMKITSIEPNRILLEKDGLKYTINYGTGK